MNELVRRALLYDFYGELLTAHQRAVYEDYVFGDLSLAEIAEQNGVSRQGVHDLIRRCEKQLNEYEEKLHLVERFAAAKSRAAALKKRLESVKTQLAAADYEEIQALLAALIEEL